MNGNIGILLGAGASWGAGKTSGEKPPMGKELFNELYKQRPNSWGKIDKEFHDIFSQRFEDGMYQYLKKNRDEVVPLFKDLAIFFSQFQIHTEKNEYYKLIHRFNSTFQKG